MPFTTQRLSGVETSKATEAAGRLNVRVFWASSRSGESTVTEATGEEAFSDSRARTPR